jgi:hypothetical protein
MKKIIVIAALLTLCVCVIWVYEKPGFDSYAALGAAFVGFIGTFFISTDQTSGQNQKVSKSGVSIQAGRDVKIHSDKDGNA